MSDEAALTGLQLADSFLPVGSYSCSYALEQFVASERVTTAAELERILRSYLTRQVGPAELVALRAAHGAAGADDVDGVVRADEHLHAATLPAEFRESASRSGTRLCDVWLETREEELLAAYVDRDPPMSYPVVLGAVAATAGVGERRACLLYGHSFCVDLLGAAQRLLSLGHTEAQRILADLRPAIVAAVGDSAGRSLTEIAPFAPLVDVLACDHERAERRLFVS